MKFFLPAIASLIAIHVFSQPKIGIKAGLSISNNKINRTTNYGTYDNSAKAGALVGILVRLPLNNKFSLRPGCEFVLKGSRERYDYGNNYRTIGHPLTYVDIPVNLVYELKRKSGQIIIGGGPEAGYNLNRNNSQYNLKKFDAGFNLLTGYELPIGFFITLNYTQGLKNLSTDKDYINNFKNYYYGLSLGYMF